MADTTKPVEVVETAPATVEPAVETSTAEPQVVEAARVVPSPAPTPAAAVIEAEADTPAAEAAPTEDATKANEPAVEEAKTEVKPIEEGTLEHKGGPAAFPKNLLGSKQHFWFGGEEPVTVENMSGYLNREKKSPTAQHVVSWASVTGKGLLFYGKEAEKSKPQGVIALADADEPTPEGTNKFMVNVKGHKHTFKAATASDRDNWVSQIKANREEAKTLAETLTVSETYASTLDSFKVKVPEAPATTAEPDMEVAQVEDASKATEGGEAKEEKKDEAKEENKEEPKRRSASRKRQSLFAGLMGKKEDKVAAANAEETQAVSEPATETPIAAESVETPTAETPAVTEPTAAEDKVAEAPKDTTKDGKPTPVKRGSLFGSLSFGKKKAEPETAPAVPPKENALETAETEPVAESAPVIPAVETSEPLSTDVNAAASTPAETPEVTQGTSAETKKDMKSEKRKSSMPFSFGKKSPGEDTDSKSSPPFFSKLRQTVKNKTKPAEKSAEKPEDKPADIAETTEGETVKTEETPAEPAAAPVTEEANTETPTTTATAPVTAAA